MWYRLLNALLIKTLAVATMVQTRPYLIYFLSTNLTNRSFLVSVDTMAADTLAKMTLGHGRFRFTFRKCLFGDVHRYINRLTIQVSNVNIDFGAIHWGPILRPRPLSSRSPLCSSTNWCIKRCCDVSRLLSYCRTQLIGMVKLVGGMDK